MSVNYVMFYVPVFCHVFFCPAISFTHVTCAFPPYSPITSLQQLVSRVFHVQCQILTVIHATVTDAMSHGLRFVLLFFTVIVRFCFLIVRFFWNSGSAALLFRII